jgi:hypothetical protein
MNDFGVLSTRKLAGIALVHSFLFLGIAVPGLAAPKPGSLLPGSGDAADIILIGFT